ncbi:rRNA maturation factor [Blattabacterium sp. (Nauphoeta cinerea)]|uniref:rRNA maturation RNase YbeY n=1 Tax=Blattabacterium sp. (Nauphoeta cinerea) TaxID=1316444 RepID=UPI0003B0D28B|nr:rRNA maturation RNase YbeY [Blattabacterium sp. (Nauphoeta cinerea)]AGW86281.1 rRNA maturation factor [Blattabacterium sp. (Nauphoeta cinerea)]
MINFFYEISNFQIQKGSSLINEICILLNNEGMYIGNINYIFCDDNFILDMNQKYLRKNFYTDVLAFDYSVNQYISGDIFISVDRVSENSKKWGQFFIYELKRVMIHAILHFLGYDDHHHINKEIMKKKEEFYLNLFQ